MRIVLITEVFSKGMGYLENMLPKYLARLGAEVHVFASSLSPDHRRNPGQEIYGGRAHSGKIKHSGRDRLETNESTETNEAIKTIERIETVDGFRLHVLKHGWTLGQVRLLGLGRAIERLEPDIVQTLKPIGWIAIDAARYRSRLGYRLFSGCHYHASVFPLAGNPGRLFSARRLRCMAERGLQGRVLSWSTEKYYAISDDCASVAARFFGVPWQKLEIAPLGVDTEIFHPAVSPEDAERRRSVRRGLGFGDEEIVCVYSGRFTEDKNPLLLARAIQELRAAGEPFRGLFLGNGPQSEALAALSGCVLHPFVPVGELGDWYRACDIGVWPTQESLSMLDASGCGLPIIANDRMGAPERLIGCGLAYRLGDLGELKDKIRALRDAGLRHQLGWHGARRIKEKSSWKVIAAHRLADYEAALSKRGSGRASVFHESASKESAPAARHRPLKT